MPNPVKEKFLNELRFRVGGLTKLPNSNSLFDVGSGIARVYIRYSKLHERGTAFYGLRREDLVQLEGQPAFVVFLWDQQAEPLLLPFSAYEELFRSLSPAADGQYKAQIYVEADSLELYVARLGRFNLEGFTGWQQLDQLISDEPTALVPELTHWQVQSIVSAIGTAKGYDIWVPQNDRGRLAAGIVGDIRCRDELPAPLAEVNDILQEIDCVWLQRGSNELRGMFEVEHTTAIYSALLRFNDVHLCSQSNQTYRVIANGARRAQFVRQLNRPTFRTSGLNEICTFLEYRNVYGWFQRVCRPGVSSPEA